MSDESKVDDGKEGKFSKDGDTGNGQVHESVKDGSTQGISEKNTSVNKEIKPGLRNFGRSRHFTDSKGKITPHWAHPEAFTKSI